MRILNDSQAVSINIEDDDSLELRNIAAMLTPEFLRLFAQKNKDYGNNAQELGLRGQFADIWRKIAKLKKSMWDGEELLFEGTDEVIMDLIGHLFLSLNMLRVREEAERAYAYNEDEAAVDAFFRMVGGEPRHALGAASVLNPPFRELVVERAEREMAADLAERIAAEAQGLIPADAPGMGVGRATTEDAAAHSAQAEARHEAYDEPVPVGEVLGMAFDDAKLHFLNEAAESFSPSVPWLLASKEDRRTAVRHALDRLRVGKSTFDAVTSGVNKTEMSLAEWLYRRHGQGRKEWADLEPRFKQLWEIEAKAAIRIARRG